MINPTIQEKAVISYLQKQERGDLINLTSGAMVFFGFGGEILYVMTHDNYAGGRFSDKENWSRLVVTAELSEVKLPEPIPA